MKDRKRYLSFLKNKEEKEDLIKGSSTKAKKQGGIASKNGFDPKVSSQVVRCAPKMSSNITSSLAVKAAIDNVAVSAALLPTITWLLEKNVLSQLMASGVSPSDCSSIVLDFANFLLAGLQNYALGAQMTVTTVPDYINVWFEAMRPKQIPFKTGSVNYSWAEGLAFVLSPVVSGPYSSFVFGDITDNETPVDTINPVPPQTGTSTNYNLVVKFFGQEQTDTAMVPVGTPAVTTKDGAAFARQYVYNGTSLTLAGGWFCDIEGEVPFKCPMFAKFVQYGSGMDVRVSRFLEPSSGDSLFSMGLPLLADFNKQYYKNRYPAVFKCIDINLIAGWLCAWAALAREQYLNANINVTNTLIVEPFPFTQQDFYIVVRQALCSVFPTQKCVQFLEPMAFSESGTSNGFVSLVTHFGTYGNPMFKNLNIPQLLQENLGCLKMRSFRPKTAHQVDRNVLNYVPVLGVYVTDTPPVWQYVYDDATINMFQDPGSEPTISLVDGSAGTLFYNLNSSYYQNIMSVWNQFTEQVTQVTTTNISIGSDNGPAGLSLLCFTNYEDSLTNTSKHRRRNKFLGKFHVKNIGEDLARTKSAEKDKNKKKTDNLPPAALTTLTYSYTTMVKGVTDEELSLLGKLILPVFRLDPTGPDPTNLTMLTTSTIEPYLLTNNTTDSNGTINGRTVLEWMNDSAGLCVTGTAGSANAAYAEMMKLLAQRGDAGTLGNIAGALLDAVGAPAVLGSLAKIIPI